MNLTNILAAVAYYSFKEPTISGLNSWIATFINWFPTIVLGVTMFTLALKLVTFPLDFYSRASMRRNSLKMEQMRPQLEKLQKQYAGDKQTYNMKMAALYKKEGYSMFGACLPSIITLVFFIIVLNAFSQYSTYQNIKYLYNMNTAFNSVVDEGVLDVDNYIWHNEEGKVVIDDKAVFAEAEKQEDFQESGTYTFTLTTEPALKVVYDFKEAEDDQSIGTVTYFTEGGYIEYNKIIKKTVNGETSVYDFASTRPELDVEAFKAKGMKNSAGQTFEEYFAEEQKNDAALTEDAAVYNFVLDIQQTRSAEKYREEKESFLWIKNIWMPDTPFQHPVYKDYNTFNSKYNLSKYTSDPLQYDNLTAKLGTEKEQVNGYLVLVVLTAGFSLLMQWVMSRGQKAQMELQSVDGQGMMTQKVMMWMMPIMMGFFSLMYTAAFSIYIIVSNVVSMLTTLLINKVVDIRFKKALEKQGEEFEMPDAADEPKKKRRKKDKRELTPKEKKERAKANRIVKKVVLERTERGVDDKKDGDEK